MTGSQATFDHTLRLTSATPAFLERVGAIGPFLGKTLTAIHVPAAELLERVVARAIADDTLRALALTLPFGYGRSPALLRFAPAANEIALTIEVLPRDVMRVLAEDRWTARNALGWIRFSPSLHVEAWSDGAAAIFGWTFDDVVGRSVGDLGLVHPDDDILVAAVIDDLLSGRVAVNTIVNRNRTRDARTIHLAWYNGTIARPDGNAIASLALDVTDSYEARNAAEASERRFRSLFERNRDPVLAVDDTGTIVEANAAAQRYFGTGRETLRGARVADLAESTERGALARAVRAVVNGEEPASSFAIRRTDGTEGEVELGGSPLDERGAAYIVVRDVTEQRRAERAVTTQAQRIRDLYVVAASTNASSERQLLATLETGCRLLGLAFATVYDAAHDDRALWVGERIPRALLRLAIATDGPLAIEDLSGLPEFADVDEGIHVGSCIVTPIDVEGTRFGTLAFASETPRETPFAETDQDLVRLMSALVATALERGRSRARLNTLAYRDALTDLPNRALLMERLHAEIERSARRSEPFGVFFCDLDRFKDVNDTLGHGAGDRLLRIVAERLGACTPFDATVARMGGDEFAILVPGVGVIADLDRIAEAILAAIEEPFAIDGFDQFLSTSIGIARYPLDGTDAETLLKHADIAMYNAKEHGRDTFEHFTPALNAAVHTRTAQDARLRQALARNEFIVHYQPQIDLATGALYGVEALVRWSHPRLGLVAPDQFIASAEASGLIVPLGDWVIREACSRVAAWQRTFDRTFRLAVNLSGRQFHRAHLGTRIAELQAESGLAPGTLEIEITESVAMSDAAYSAGVLRDLRAAGIGISLDDFGTGYSSLSYLRRFAIDAIKIDKSFVRDVTTQTDAAVIVRSITAMAAALHLEAVAEGVENEAQREFMRDAGCARAQGFYFSTPLDDAAMTAYLTSIAARVPLSHP